METALELLKSALGFTSSVRDDYLTALVGAVVDELKQIHGYTPDLEDIHQIMFVVDVAEWRYNGRNSPGPMPLHLRRRLLDFLIRYAERAEAQ